MEFEAWFLAAAASLRGHRRLTPDLEPPPHPEEIRGAKEWIAQRMTHGAYSPSVDQAALTHTFDLELALQTQSFAKCYREVTRLLDAARDM
jgi:hypothetical protein